MSDSLKLKYDQLGKSDKSKSDNPQNPKSTDEILFHEAEGNARNLTLVLPDGKRVFLNYAYLISGELSAENDAITLQFTTHTVTLKGRALEGLFEDLTAHKPQQIKSLEERYAFMKEKIETLVFEIILKENIE